MFPSKGRDSPSIFLYWSGLTRLSAIVNKNVLLLMAIVVLMLFLSSGPISGLVQREVYKPAGGWHIDAKGQRPPRGIAIDSSGHIYLADALNDRIQKLTPEGKLILEWGSTGRKIGQFWVPAAIAVDLKRGAYVVDHDNNRVQRFDSNGTFIMSWGSEGAGEGKFLSPEGIAVDTNGGIYVVESTAHRVQKFTEGGRFITKWGSLGEEDGQFAFPNAIAVDFLRSAVYVVDSGNYRIQKFTTQGEFIRKWGSFGTLEGKFTSPNGIAVDSDGNVYVLDAGNNRIQKFNLSGQFMTAWDVGSPGPELLGGMTIDVNGTIYLVDAANNSIRKYARYGFEPVTIAPSSKGDLKAAETIQGAQTNTPNQLIGPDSTEILTILLIGLAILVSIIVFQIKRKR